MDLGPCTCLLASGTFEPLCLCISPNFCQLQQPLQDCVSGKRTLRLTCSQEPSCPGLVFSQGDSSLRSDCWYHLPLPYYHPARTGNFQFLPCHQMHRSSLLWLRLSVQVLVWGPLVRTCLPPFEPTSHLMPGSSDLKRVLEQLQTGGDTKTLLLVWKHLCLLPCQSFEKTGW